MPSYSLREHGAAKEFPDLLHIPSIGSSNLRAVTLITKDYLRAFLADHWCMPCSAEHESLPDADEDEASCGGQDCHIPKHRSFQHVANSSKIWQAQVKYLQVFGNEVVCLMY